MSKKEKNKEHNKGHHHPEHDKKKSPTSKEDLKKAQGGANSREFLDAL